MFSYILPLEHFSVISILLAFRQRKSSTFGKLGAIRLMGYTICQSTLKNGCLTIN